MATQFATELACESRSEKTSSGCCADGRNCDEVCIAVIAAEECRQSMHDGCHNDPTAVDKRTEQLAKVALGTQDSQSCLKQCCGVSDVASNKRTPTNSVCTAASECHTDVTVNEVSDGPLKSVCMNKIDFEQDSSTTSISWKACAAKFDPCCDTASDENSEGRSDSDQKSPEVAMNAVVDGKSTGLAKWASEPTKKSCCGSDEDCATKADQNFNQSTLMTGFREACEAHLEKAMKKYSAYLEAGKCICRQAVKSIDVCCSQDRRAAVTGKRKALQGPVRSCCTPKRCKLDTPSESIEKDRTVVSYTRLPPTDTLCDGKLRGTRAKSCASAINQKPSSSCCRGTPVSEYERVSGSYHQQDCCSLKVNNAGAYIGPKIEHQLIDTPDPEREAAREHVGFSITGMTCTGCVKKVFGSLNQVNGVGNVKINFVTATGSMDVDGSKITAVAALARLEHETGFRCSRIITDLQSMRVVMTRTVVQELQESLPKGIETLEKSGKNYRIQYDPTVIGAREVLRRTRGTLAPPEAGNALLDGQKAFLLKLWSFLVATISTIPVVVIAWADIDISFLAKSVTSFVLATVVQLIAIPEFYIPALKALIFSKTIEMDMLVVVSITAAYFYSVIAFGLQHAGVVIQQGEIFETSTLLITLILLGRLVSAYSKRRAVRSVSLRSLQAETTYLEDSREDTRQIDARLLEFSDVVLVKPHTKIVSDGDIIEGHSEVDESMLTGESVPVAKTVGMKVVAGTLNGSGLLRISITRLPGQNSITDIANLVQDALAAKPRIQDLADVVAGYFVPFVLVIAILVFAVWVAIVLRVQQQSPGGAIGRAITYSIAVLAISCPCALGLAVPLCLVIAGGVAARNGVVIKQGNVTERAFKVTDVVFDKTGTLTTGKLKVIRQVEHENDMSHRSFIGLALALVKDNDHPVSQAVAAFLKDQDVIPAKIESIKSIPGAGIQAINDGATVKAGNPYWLNVVTDPAIAALQAEGLTILTVTVDSSPVVSFGLKADLRPEARSVVQSLVARGLSCHIVSGDSSYAVANVANILNIDTDRAVSRQSPADKRQYVQTLSMAGKTTLFIGDGTNDAVAVAQADVGVQIGGSASDVTKATADVVLLGGLDGLLALLEVSKQTYYRIIFNFVWAFVYNLFAILLAAGAFVKIRIPPSFAGLGEIVSVVPVVLATMTLLRINPKQL